MAILEATRQSEQGITQNLTNYEAPQLDEVREISLGGLSRFLKIRSLVRYINAMQKVSELENLVLEVGTNIEIVHRWTKDPEGNIPFPDKSPVPEKVNLPLWRMVKDGVIPRETVGQIKSRFGLEFLFTLDSHQPTEPQKDVEHLLYNWVRGKARRTGSIALKYARTSLYCVVTGLTRGRLEDALKSFADINSSQYVSSDNLDSTDTILQRQVRKNSSINAAHTISHLTDYLRPPLEACMLLEDESGENILYKMYDETSYTWISPIGLGEPGEGEEFLLDGDQHNHDTTLVEKQEQEHQKQLLDLISEMIEALSVEEKPFQ